MAKSIGLKQLDQKVFNEVPGLPADIQDCIGDIEDTFDTIIYGLSGNGKTNFTVILLKALLKAMPKAKAEYVSYEEGHGKTVQALMRRHNMLEEVGNRVLITEHISGPDLKVKMGKKHQAKIWVIDSLQASGLSYKECKDLKETFVQSRKKKIIIYVSWGDGKKPHGSCAINVEFYANIKLHVRDMIVFSKSRYGGNKPYVIWEEEAKARWGAKYKKIIKSKSKEKPISNETISEKPLNPISNESLSNDLILVPVPRPDPVVSE